MGEWKDVTSVGEIPPSGLRVVVEDEELLLVRVGEDVRALSYLCSHQEMALEGGRILDGAWVCPHHGARFSLDNGEALSMPAVSGIRIVQTRVEDGRVFVMCPV